MKKKVMQLWFYSVYCLLTLIGVLLDFEVFSGKISTKPFVYYTSLSNMACSAFILISLIRSIRYGDNGCGFAPLCKYIFVVMILVTAIVYNLLLNPYRSLIAYFSAIKNCLYHLILPIMFLLDWLFFYRRGTVKPLYPLLAIAIPLMYVIYILLRAVVVRSAGMTVAVLYPYFFFNVDRLGWHGVALWMGLLFVALIMLGYALYALDRLLCRKATLSKA